MTGQAAAGNRGPDRYVVVGNPIAHSLSPQIHARFAEQTGERIEYDRLLAPLDGFRDCADAFISEGGRGLNVTVPFKGEAARWVNTLTPLAAQARAVNTVVVTADGTTLGHNTDGIGLITDLKRLAPELKGVRVLMIGAGGAARGVALPLLDGGAGTKAPAAELVIANRSADKAVALAGSLREAGHQSAIGVGLGEVVGPFDLVINATSTGLEGAVPAVAPGVVRDALCYDMSYGGETAFCRWARASGAASVHDGLGMLVEQAALAFELWRGVRPRTEPVRVALRDSA